MSAVRDAAVLPDQLPSRRTSAIDPVRLAICTLFSLMATTNVLAFVNTVTGDRPLWQRGAQALASALSFAFAACVVRAYLRRGPARATDQGTLIRVVAALATFGPVAVGTALPGLTGGPRQVVSLALTLCGLAFAVWSVRTLSTSLSIVPQARQLIARGPYRVVRHPLYLGEIVAVAGMSLHGGWRVAVVFTVLEAGLQAFRASREERLLSAQLPGYREYAAGTRRLLPGIW
jgi:protein-S-isoprenylcysteine O-methyltransferase Ste14